MYEYEYAHETTASPEAIFKFYNDVQAWRQWDEGILAIELNGAFVEGSRGKLTVVGQNPLDFTLTEVLPNRGFADETPLPEMGITIVFNHTLIPQVNGGTRIVHQVKIVGPAAEQVGPELGPMITADLPEAVAKLAHLAEAQPVIA